MRITVTYPVTFEIDDSEFVDANGEEISQDAKRNVILDRADYFLTSCQVDPVITECDDQSLVD